MASIFTYGNIPIVVAVFVAVLFIGITLFVIYRKKSSRDKEKFFFDQIKAVNRDSAFEDAIDSKDTPIKRMIQSLDHKLKAGGLVDELSNGNANAAKFGLILVLLYFVSTIVFRNPFIGLVPVAIAAAGVLMFCGNKIKAQHKRIEEQIPGFLNSLKSNIQANNSPENALAAAIDNTAEPLHDELRVAKALIDTGSFTTALRAMRKRTTSESLKFLCSAIELSVDVGANLEEQINIIEEVFMANKALDRKLQGAVAENKPLMYVTAILVPGLFLVMYALNEQARSFWFHAPLSWALLLGVIGLLILCYFLTKRIIETLLK